MKKLAIFDLDGTLLHTVPDITERINEMLAHFNHPLVTEEFITQSVGCGARSLVHECINENLTEAELDERLNFYNSNYTASSSPKTKIFDGISEVLKALKSAGFYIAILTNKPQQTTNRVYKEYLEQFGFDKVVGSSAEVKCKPDKTSTINILNEFNVKPENTYFIGDGETDVKTAINAGVNGIAVLWGYRNREQLSCVGAKVFAERPLDILKIIGIEEK